MERSAGILLPIFSLPSRYGIGSLGREARDFVDFLQDAGQKWWQILPVGPTGGGESPYTSLSTFAGNHLFIDLDDLAEKGLLTQKDLEDAKVPQGGRIDYPMLRATRQLLLRRAFNRITPEEAGKARQFREETPWLKNYTLFCAAKEHFSGAPWYVWPDEGLRRHDAGAMERWQIELAEDMAFHTWLQYVFFRQWAEMKAYANNAGVKIIGDLPIYVSLDSADVWSERKEFLLDSEGHPQKVAGVPPDYFSKDGQLWGNPLYDWKAMKADGFGWWIRRVEGASKLCDAIRIDHFRGLESYWAVPAGAESAKEGAWEKGPGMALLGVLTSWFPQITYIAEDLGILTDDVHELRKASGLPGMKVLQFAFDNPGNAYLPHNYQPNCICYTGTHDNNTVVGWYEAAGEEEKAYVAEYLGVSGTEEVRKAILRCGQGSIAELFVAQMQDYLALNGDARINVPGVVGGNWGWRMEPDQATDQLAKEVKQLTHTFGRC